MHNKKSWISSSTLLTKRNNPMIAFVPISWKASIIVYKRWLDQFFSIVFQVRKVSYMEKPRFKMTYHLLDNPFFLFQHHQWICSSIEDWTQDVLKQSFNSSSQGEVSGPVPCTGKNGRRNGGYSVIRARNDPLNYEISLWPVSLNKC